MIKRIVYIILLVMNSIVYSTSLTIGVLAFAPPFSLLSGNNNSSGFSIDLMNEICKRIDVHCRYKELLFLDQEKILKSGGVDIVLTLTPISSIDDKYYSSSLPYLPSNAQFLTLKNNGIKTINDLKNKKIGVVKISLFLSYLQNKKMFSEIIEFNNLSDLISAIVNKKVDAVIMDHNIALYTVNGNFIENGILIGDEIPFGLGYGMFALKKNAALISKINSALLNIESDGTYTFIYNKYFSK